MQTHYSSYHRQPRRFNQRSRIRLAMIPRSRTTMRRKIMLFGSVLSGAFAIIFLFLSVNKTENALAAITYTSLANGSWTNTTTVWSTNGSTACGCTPGTTVTNNVVINHDINMNTDLTLNPGGRIDISLTGSLINTNQNLTITSGTLVAYGPVSVKEITIGPGGSGLFHGSVSVVSKFFAEGGVLFDSLTTISNGSLELKPGSSLNAGDGWEINIPNGNISNQGSINFHGTCLVMNNGSFYNQVGGSVMGYGYIETKNGNFYNYGTYWSASVNWCASGTGDGMPQPEYCNDCGSGFALPVELIDFNGSLTNQASVILKWATASETNNDYFTLERSTDAIEFIPVARIDGAGNSNSILNYSYTDTPGSDGTLCFYRLRQTDHDGTTVTFKTVSVNNYDKDNYGTISVFPNPFSGSLVAGFKSVSGETVNIKIVSRCGKHVFTDKVISRDGNNAYHFNAPSDFEPGIYLLTVSSETKMFDPVRIVYSR